MSKNNWSNLSLNNPYTQFQHGDQNEIKIEQQLLDELVYNFGHTILYLPRTWVNEDAILGEDNESEFNKAIPLPVRWLNAEDWEGSQLNIQQFGLGFDLQLQFYVSENDWDKHIINSTEGNLSNDKTKSHVGTKIGMPAVGDIIIFNPYPNVSNRATKPMYLEISSTHNISISPISIRYGWQMNCNTLDYDQNSFNIDDVQDAKDLMEAFSNDIEYIGNEVGSDELGFGNNNDLIDNAFDKVYDPSNKFRKKQTINEKVKDRNDYEI